MDAKVNLTQNIKKYFDIVQEHIKNKKDIEQSNKRKSENMTVAKHIIRENITELRRNKSDLNLPKNKYLIVHPDSENQKPDRKYLYEKLSNSGGTSDEVLKLLLNEISEDKKSTALKTQLESAKEKLFDNPTLQKILQDNEFAEKYPEFRRKLEKTLKNKIVLEPKSQPFYAKDGSEEEFLPDSKQKIPDESNLLKFLVHKLLSHFKNESHPFYLRDETEQLLSKNKPKIDRSKKYPDLKLSVLTSRNDFDYTEAEKSLLQKLIFNDYIKKHSQLDLPRRKIVPNLLKSSDVSQLQFYNWDASPNERSPQMSYKKGKDSKGSKSKTRHKYTKYNFEKDLEGEIKLRTPDYKFLKKLGKGLGKQPKIYSDTNKFETSFDSSFPVLQNPNILQANKILRHTTKSNEKRTKNIKTQTKKSNKKSSTTKKKSRKSHHQKMHKSKKVTNPEVYKSQKIYKVTTATWNTEEAEINSNIHIVNAFEELINVKEDDFYTEAQIPADNSLTKDMVVQRTKPTDQENIDIEDYKVNLESVTVCPA